MLISPPLSPHTCYVTTILNPTCTNLHYFHIRLNTKPNVAVTYSGTSIAIIEANAQAGVRNPKKGQVELTVKGDNKDDGKAQKRDFGLGSTEWHLFSEEELLRELGTRKEGLTSQGEK